MFCGCKSPAERLLELNLWPATSTKPTLAFTIELMSFAQMIILNCYASLYDIVSFLKATRIKQRQVYYSLIVPLKHLPSFYNVFYQDKDIYKQFTTAFPQYR